MKGKGIVFALAMLTAMSAWAQRGKDGAGNIAGAGSQVNAYTTLTANASSGATTITVASNALGTNFSSNLAAGDLIMIYQTRGATLNGVLNGNIGNPNSVAWGAVNSLDEAGNWEYAQVEAVTGGTGITLTCALQNSYTSADDVQVIRVPRYTDLTITGSITAPAWNGSTGGIVAVEVEGTLTNNGSIDVTGLGFRGGSLVGDNNSTFWPGWATTSSDLGAEKGEGVGGYQGDYDNIGGRYARAAAGNGGGGGDAHNCGGGGGANASPNIASYIGYGVPNTAYNDAWDEEVPPIDGLSSIGGGRGGYSHSTNDCNANNQGPNDPCWGADLRRPYGGYGGRPLDYSTGKLFFGGGGGAGDQNNLDGGEGGSGGGLIYIMSYGSVGGSGSFIANGNAGGDTDNSNPPFGGYAGNDGAGGGGAGGAIVVNSEGTIAGGLTFQANGGAGGDQLLAAGLFGSVGEAEGPGGGGGGGYIALSNAGATTSAAGGIEGTTNSPQLTEFPPNGATAGNVGLPGESVSVWYLNPSDVTICSGQSTNLIAPVVGTLPGGTTIAWWDQEVGGTQLGTGAIFATGTLTSTTTYYVGTCPGHYRTEVTVTVTPGPVIDISNISIVDESCTGNDGSITGITVSGGTPAYTYSWSNSGGSNVDVTGASAGSYTLTVTDAIGCVSTSGPHVIGSNGGLTIDVSNVSIVDENCSQSDGAISGVSVSGGSGSYTYDWNSGAYSTVDISGIPAGSYSLFIDDGAGCTGTAGPFTVTNTAGPTINTGAMVISNETCGSTNGSITGITISGGTPGYMYTWNGNNATGPDTSGLGAGNYTLMVTDANGCVASSGPHTIINSPGPVIDETNVVIVDENCGSADGSITGITFSGGTGPLTTDWNNGFASTLNISSLTAGTYTLIVTDANGCADTSSVQTVGNIGGPSIDQTNMVVTDETCGSTNGAITGIVVSGGTPGYTFDWNGNGTLGADTIGLAGGNYTLTVTDAGGCVATAGPIAVGSIAGPTLNTAGMVLTNESCSAVNGSINGITVVGGTAPFTYDWNGNTATGPDTLGLAAGSYTLTVTDANGCIVTSGPHNITNAAGPVIDSTNVVIVDENCGQSDGSITGILVSGGSGPYSFDWNAGFATTLDIINIPAGTYTLTVTDGNGCVATTGVYVVNNIGGPAINITNMVVSDETCTAANGSITGITVSGGTPGYTFDWNGSGTLGADTIGLAAGNYTLTVTDAGGCVATAGPFAIVDLAGPTIDNTNAVVVDETCTAVNGSITGIVVSGGTGPLVYDWSGNNASGPDTVGLGAGNYTLTVTDANGCMATSGPYAITDSPGPVIDETNVLIADENCGQSDGSVTGLTVSGGSGTITYDWNNGLSNQLNLTGVGTGSYTLVVTDANGCTDTSSAFNVNSIGGPVIDISNMVITDEGCLGNDGSITGITVSGGNPGYTFDWNGNATPSADLTGASAGNYTLTVTDNSGCASVVGPFVIGTVNITPIVATINTDLTICAGDLVTISGSASGGGSGLTYVIDDNGNPISSGTLTGGSTTFDVNPTMTTTYCITVVDSCGSVPATACFTVTVDPLFAPIITATDTAACGSLTTTVTVPAGLYASVDWDFGDGTGTATGETATYTYNSVGTYTVTVTVTNGAGCSETFTYGSQMHVFATPNANFTATPQPAILPNANVSFTDQSTGGVNTWQWDFAGQGSSSSQDPTFDFTPSGVGVYPVSLTVTTPDGCTDVVTIDILVIEELPAIIIPNVFTPNADGSNDVFEIQNLPAGNHDMQIFNRWGQLIFKTNDYLNNWDGYTSTGLQVPEGTYYYVLVLEDGTVHEGYLTLTR